MFARRISVYAFCFLVSAILFAVFSPPLKSRAQIEIPNNVATQGRTLSPAGKLVFDRTTNLPAVAPLTVDFVRSPDNAGADGKGRYLVTVNSGFGLQFNSKARRSRRFR